MDITGNVNGGASPATYVEETMDQVVHDPNNVGTHYDQNIWRGGQYESVYGYGGFYAYLVGNNIQRVPASGGPSSYPPSLEGFENEVRLEVNNNDSNVNIGMEPVGPEEDMSQYLSLGIQPSDVRNDRALGVHPRNGVAQEEFRVGENIMNLAMLDAQYRLVTAENEELRMIMNEIRRERNEAEHFVTELQGRVSFLEGDNVMYMNEIDRLRAERRELRSRVRSLESNVARVYEGSRRRY